MAEPKLIVTIDPLVPLVIAAQNESGGEKQIVCFLTLEIFNNSHNSANCNPRGTKTQKIFI